MNAKITITLKDAKVLFSILSQIYPREEYGEIFGRALMQARDVLGSRIAAAKLRHDNEED